MSSKSKPEAAPSPAPASPSAARKRMSPASRLATDAIGAVFSIGPVALTWALVVLLGAEARARGWLVPYLILSPLLSTSVFIALVRAFRLLLPRLRSGVFRIGFNVPVLAWYCHLALNRSAKLSGLRPLIFSFYVTRYLLFRALGAKVAFDVTTSIELVLVDLPLITIGAGSTIGEGVHISCHYFVGDRLLLKPTVVGEDCFVGMRCVLGPGSRLGDGAWVGFGNIVSGERLAPGQVVGDGDWLFGGPTRPKPESIRKLGDQVAQLLSDREQVG